MSERHRYLSGGARSGPGVSALSRLVSRASRSHLSAPQRRLTPTNRWPISDRSQSHSLPQANHSAQQHHSVARAAFKSLNPTKLHPTEPLSQRPGEQRGFAGQGLLVGFDVYRDPVGGGTPSCLQIVRVSSGPISLCRGTAATSSFVPRHFACFDPPTSRQPCARRCLSRSRLFTPRRRSADARGRPPGPALPARHPA